MPPLILASNLPRRRELLYQIGLAFTAVPAHVDESVLPREVPASCAERAAHDKARSAVKQMEKGIVIAADTIVVVGGAIFGKPAYAADARRMLAEMSRREHEVVNGPAVTDAATGESIARRFYERLV